MSWTAIARVPSEHRQRCPVCGKRVDALGTDEGERELKEHARGRRGDRCPGSWLTLPPVVTAQTHVEESYIRPPAA